LSAGEITTLREAIAKAEGSKSERGKLKSHSSSLEKSAGTAKNATDAARMRALAEIMKKPSA
jgi:hypothetical protein